MTCDSGKPSCSPFVRFLMRFIQRRITRAVLIGLLLVFMPGCATSILRTIPRSTTNAVVFQDHKK